MKTGDRKSVTLVELMIAAALIVAFLVIIIGLFIACSRLNENSRNTTTAVSSLEYVMEQIKDVPDLTTLGENIDNGSWDWGVTEVTNEGLQPLPAETISVCCYDSSSSSCFSTCPDQDPLSIFAEVQWQNRMGESRSFSLKTLLTD